VLRFTSKGARTELEGIKGCKECKVQGVGFSKRVSVRVRMIGLLVSGLLSQGQGLGRVRVLLGSRDLPFCC
jgi:hypothetical protein